MSAIYAFTPTTRPEYALFAKIQSSGRTSRKDEQSWEECDWIPKLLVEVKKRIERIEEKLQKIYVYTLDNVLPQNENF